MGRVSSWSLELELESGVSSRNRPLRGFATHREANTPSGASAEGSGVRSWSLELELENGG